ncbi:hypothetical protein RHMOL_Rhmol02G0294100 [Rhododendron molle]|uniref:Uncharacterized protein n=1 Tax=Rhododendron molle TaxID=49168 RepID=A0ACC0PXA4_RHOML|nr:hypothetical protein RHMOL_Rhmol02G0294100 [Rhododendron molle]
MNKKISGIVAAAVRESFGSRRPLPKRGQIKSRIAASAFHSIVSAFLRAPSHYQQSSGESHHRDTKDIRNH